MDYFAGLDVSVKETSVCIVDDAGKIVREVKVASEPEADVSEQCHHFRLVPCPEVGPRSTVRPICTKAEIA